ncbi:MAG: hypothetical protein ACXVRJ_08670 [Gaiellaceae bacterium]
MRLVIVYCGIAAALFSAGASAGTSRSERLPTLRADVGEWSIVPSTGSVPAGRVLIRVRNVGGATHRLVLVRTTSFDQRLPLRGSRAAVRPLIETVLVRPGEAASFVVSLRPGSYLLLDNLPWHYWQGTFVAFSVR